MFFFTTKRYTSTDDTKESTAMFTPKVNRWPHSRVTRCDWIPHLDMLPEIKRQNIWAVFHLPNDSGIFRKISETSVGNVYRWRTCSIWHTRRIHSQAPFTVWCISRQNSKWRHNCCCWTKYYSSLWKKRVSLIQMMRWFHSYPGGGCNLYEARSSQKYRFLWKYFACIYHWWI